MSDYISREELLKHQYRIDDSASLSTRDVVNVEDVEDCPPADVRENIHGKWIFVQRDKFTDVCCSKCGYARVKEYAYGYTLEALYAQGIPFSYQKNFCENCGADMRGE